MTIELERGFSVKVVEKLMQCFHVAHVVAIRGEY